MTLPPKHWGYRPSAEGRTAPPVPPGGRGGGSGYTDIQSRVLVVDGVSYTAPRIRQLVLERRQLASEVIVLRERLRRNDVHLRRRADALIRLIARKGPVLS